MYFLYGKATPTEVLYIRITDKETGRYAVYRLLANGTKNFECYAYGGNHLDALKTVTDTTWYLKRIDRRTVNKMQQRCIIGANNV